MNEQGLEKSSTLKDLLNDPRSSINDQIKLIEEDQELSSLIMDTVNSAIYVTRRRVMNLRQAVVLLGNRKIREILNRMQRKRDLESKAEESELEV